MCTVPVCSGFVEMDTCNLKHHCPATRWFVITARFLRLLPRCRERFDRSGQPRDLHLFQVVAVGNGKGRGLSVLAAEGLVTRYTYRCSYTFTASLLGTYLGSMLACLARSAVLHGKRILLCQALEPARH